MRRFARIAPARLRGLHVVTTAHSVVVGLLLRFGNRDGDLCDEALGGEHQGGHTGTVLHGVDRHLEKGTTKKEEKSGRVSERAS